MADGRWKVIAGETGVAAAFIVTAAIAVTGPAWLLVAGLTGHGLKDLWQHRTHYVANTRWSAARPKRQAERLARGPDAGEHARRRFPVRG